MLTPSKERQLLRELSKSKNLWVIIKKLCAFANIVLDGIDIVGEDNNYNKTVSVITGTDSDGNPITETTTCTHYIDINGTRYPVKKDGDTWYYYDSGSGAAGWHPIWEDRINDIRPKVR